MTHCPLVTNNVKPWKTKTVQMSNVTYGLNQDVAQKNITPNTCGLSAQFLVRITKADPINQLKVKQEKDPMFHLKVTDPTPQKKMRINQPTVKPGQIQNAVTINVICGQARANVKIILII